MDQNRAPLVDAIRKHIETARASFHIHAHRGQNGAPEDLVALLGGKVFEADLTELPGLDDLYEPAGPIREAQALAAEAYGSDRCWFLVNGTTSGNIAMILAAVGRGEKILLDSAAHRSARAGAELAGAEIVDLPRTKNAVWGLDEPTDPADVRAALEKDPSVRAVFLVSPTYFGIASPLREIAEICHAAGVPLLVDEAHGAHFHFSELLPKDALTSGADLVAQSTHKTAGSLGQSSLLHWQGELVDPDVVDAKLKLITTSSPSYLLMASLDAARRQMATEGENLIRRAADLANTARKRWPNELDVEVLSPENWGSLPAPETDPLRIVFSASKRGICGTDLAEQLRGKGVFTELADERNVLAIITWGNQSSDFIC